MDYNYLERQHEELEGFETAVKDYLKSLQVAKDRLMKGSPVEYGYIMEKLEAIENQAKLTMKTIKEAEEEGKEKLKS